MIALVQRVSTGEVRVDGKPVGTIGRGIVALIGVSRGDDEASAARLLERVLEYRIFPGETPQDAGRMARSLRDIAGGLLLVPQFTLAADTRKGTRAGFSTAAEPGEARRLFEHLVTLARAAHTQVAMGQFGADMQVALVNEGPVTFWLETASQNPS